MTVEHEHTADEVAAIRRVARMMREEAARLPDESYVAGALENGAEEALARLGVRP